MVLNSAAEPTAILNPGQNIVDKFMKLSKVSFSMECFTADFLQVLAQLSQFVSWVAG